LKNTTFIRPSLAAAAKANPMAEVEWLLDVASGILEGQLDDEPDQRAYSLLGYWVAFKRFRPELLANAKAGGVVRQLNREVKTHGKELARLAFGVMNPEAWLRSAKKFDKRTGEDFVPAEEAVAKAADLWWDLDEASCVQAARELLGIKNRSLQRRLQKCLNWAIVNPSAFYFAAVSIQAMAKCFKPELEEEDSPIGYTCLKYQLQLAGMCEIEEKSRFENLGWHFSLPDLRAFLKRCWNSPAGRRRARQLRRARIQQAPAT